MFDLSLVLAGTLSGDNLIVFMMLLQQAGLPYAHHITAVSHGMLAALGMRVVLSLAGAMLLPSMSLP